MTILFNATRFAAIVLVGASFGILGAALASASDKAPKAQMQKQGVKPAKAQAPSTRRTGKKNSKALRRTKKPGNTSIILGQKESLNGRSLLGWSTSSQKTRSGKKESTNGRSLLGGSTSGKKMQSGKLSNNGRSLNANVLDISNGPGLLTAQSRHRVIVQNGRLILEPATTSLED